MSDLRDAATGHAGGPETAPSSVRLAAEAKAKATAQGIGLFLLALMLFGLMDVAAKKLAQDYPPAMVVWARFAVNLALVTLLFRGKLLTLVRSHQPGLQFLRGCFQMGTVALFFIAIRYIGLADAAALGALSPVLITLGAALFLGEKLGAGRIIGIVAAFTGALIVLRPGAGVMHPAAILALLACFTYAGGALLTRVVRFDSTATSVLWSAMVGTGLSSLALPFFWQEVAPIDLPLFLAVGALGAVGQAALIVAFRKAEAGSIAPFGYSDLIFSGLWGWAFFAQLPDLYTVIGALVIVAAGVYVWSRERAETKADARSDARAETGNE
ncbi:DMT family transporter [Rhodobacter capsulatus]|uniref:Permease of the drug/metabolite transporter (DMT) superfamily n=1 Tax=Rhodobacter capsulatus TaxID=1061 RepID=A0A1G7DB22_RHOCA|nr:DMT family transporter [Rhodobacter capsulatus]WER10947.1 DMT family transporter [Rhodobacter capsulatus]SDE48757.1 Permease of the drug/metabolite transporter (DMT) superfamily [Rhodobacter capsulatus]